MLAGMQDPPRPVRAFTAIELPDPVRDALVRVQGKLKRAHARVGWTAPDNLHLTLVFLGDIPADRIEAAAEALDAAAGTIPPFRFQAAGLGAFGSPHRPRVVWAAIPDPPPALMALHQALCDRFGEAGFAREDRPFHPHVTLGRVRGPQGVTQLTSAMASANNSEFGEVSVHRVVLMHSRLAAQGPRYTIMRESPLKGS
ncbi:MAG: RNA 2',3'-cyclic phosphodiesterase [Anaerolineae bacterium]